MAQTEVDINRVIEMEPRVADFVIDADVHVTPPPDLLGRISVT